MIWKQAYGFPQYEVSDMGQVRSLFGRYKNKPRLHILKLQTTAKGYASVSLQVNNKSKFTRVHKLVLETFVSPRPSANHVADHINRIRNDNRLENLRWVTAYENVTTYSEGMCAKNKRKTHCLNGHELNETNAFHRKQRNGVIGRQCKICNRMRMKERKARLRREKKARPEHLRD